MSFVSQQRKDPLVARVPLTRMSVSSIVFEGNASKEGGTVKSWKRRWFRFTEDGRLAYYKAQSDKKALGTIDITTCSKIETDIVIDASKPHGFAIHAPSRVYRIACPSAEDKIQWSNHLAAKIAVAEAVSVHADTDDEEEAKEDTTSKPEEIKAEVDGENDNENATTNASEEPAGVATEAANEEPVAATASEEPSTEATTEEPAAEPAAETAAEPVADATEPAAEPAAETTEADTTPTVSAASSLEGYLMKTGGGKKSDAWRQRWFKFEGTSLQYQAHATTAPKGTIDLTQCCELSLTNNLFKIVVPGRTYNIKAETDEVANKWVKALNPVVPEAARFEFPAETEAATCEGDDVPEAEVVENNPAAASTEPEEASPAEEQKETAAAPADEATGATSDEKDAEIERLTKRVAELEAELTKIKGVLGGLTN